MTRFNVQSLLVQRGAQDCEIVGVISERDIVRSVQHNPDATASLLVRDVMSPDDIVGSEQWPLERCLKTMLGASLRHMPIVGIGGVVNSMLSVPEICRAITEDNIDGVIPAEPATLAEAVEETRRARADGDIAERSSAGKPAEAGLQPSTPPHISQVAGQNAPVADALARMYEDRTGSVLLVADPIVGGESLGLFTERDLVKHLAKSGGSTDWLAAPVSAHMTPVAELLRLDPSCPAFNALALMTQRGCSHLTVGNAEVGATAGGSHGHGAPLLGVVSMGALLRYVVDNS